MLANHPLRGHIYENWVVSEYCKKYYNRGIEPPLYFWRDARHEIDLVIDEGSRLYPVEIKSSYTFNSDFVTNLEYFCRLQKIPIVGDCVYAGDKNFTFQNFNILPWSVVGASSAAARPS